MTNPPDISQLDREILEILNLLEQVDSGLERSTLLGNLARRFNQIGDFATASRIFDQAVAEHEDDPTVLRSLGLAMFGEGQWAEGLAVYFRARPALANLQNLDRHYPHPKWRGEEIAGKSVLLWAEQGIGDHLMQLRLLQHLGNWNATFTIECDARLHPMIKRSFPGTECVANTPESQALLRERAFDLQCSLFEAWRWHNLPQPQSAYLKVDAGLMGAFRRTWQSQGWHLNIGLSWRSSARASGSDRTLAPHHLSAFTHRNDVTFHSLQYDADAAEVASLSKTLKRPIWSDSQLNPKEDLDRLAAQMAALDLIISIDNATVHIAGAIGAPCWVLLPARSDWRWGPSGETTGLYDSLRLFRNVQTAHWGGIIYQVYDQLKKWDPQSA